MSAKAKPSKRKPSRASQPARKPAASGKRHQPERAGLVVPPTGTGNSAKRDNQPPALKISMHGRTGVHVDLMTLPKDVCELDTEAKLLQCMEDLLPIVSKANGFRDNTRWSNSSSVADVFHTFFTKVFTLLKADFGKIVLKDGVYRLVIKDGVYFDVTCPVMPVYFLPALEKADRELFDLSFYLVVLLHKQSHVQLWNDDNENYIFENIEGELAHMKTRKGDGDCDKEIAELELAFHEYGENGPATLFHKRLWKSGASKRVWLKAFEEFKPKTAMENDFYKWLRIGKELVEEGKSIHDFISMPPDMVQEYEQYEQVPNTPDQCVKFLWRADDYWFRTFDDMNESASHNEGSLPFYNYKVIESFADIKEIKDCFPAKLIRFMAAGRQLESKYRNVFCDEAKLKKALTPEPKKLIDIL